MSISIGSGIYALYVMRTGAKGALSIDSFKTKLDAIEQLTREILVWEGYGKTEATAQEIRDRIEETITAYQKAYETPTAGDPEDVDD